MKYSNPHDEYHMIDNTIIEPSENFRSGPIFFAPFVSDKGEDGVLIDWRKDDIDFINHNGAPNLKLHGQAIYHVCNILKNGGIVKGIRITAKNATYSNLILMLKLIPKQVQKVDVKNNPLYVDNKGQETIVSAGNKPCMVDKLESKLYFESFLELKNLEDSAFSALVRTKYAKNEKTGEVTLPLFALACKGKGKCGDDYRVRVVPNRNLDRDNLHRSYSLEILENNNGIKREVSGTPLIISLYPYAKNKYGTSSYIGDVVRKNVLPIKLVAIDDFIVEALDLITKSENAIRPLNKQLKDCEIDLINLLDRNGVDKYASVSQDPDSVNLTALDGYSLLSGTDGDFDIKNQNRFDAIYERYADLFKGTITDQIFDVQEEINVTLDANFPLEVKKLMTSWQHRRDDHAVIFDASIMQTVQNVKEFKQSEFNNDRFGTTTLTDSVEVYDEYTGKIIRVTETYLYSITLPRHLIDANGGAHVPMAGLNCRLDDLIIPNSVLPKVTDDATKSELYDLRANYIEKEAGHYVYATQLTDLKVTSDLTDLNNVLTYYQIKRTILNLTPKFRYRFTDNADDLRALNNMASDAIDKYRKGQTNYINIDVKPDKTDPRGKRLKVTCPVIFRRFGEQCDILVSIDRVQ